MISVKKEVQMGGIGSGRLWYYDAKDTTSSYRNLDIRQLDRRDLLKVNNSFIWQWVRDGETIASIQMAVQSNHIMLSYRVNQGDEWVDQKYPVYIERTSCHLGGRRPWFRCPARGCEKRVAILYGGNIFACRHCYRLAYQSQREGGYYRAIRKIDKIRNLFNWESGFLNGEGMKPKGMHWRTFNRLYTNHDKLLQFILSYQVMQFGIK